MENYSKMIEDAISCLNWNLVMNYYNEDTYQLKKITKETVKKELRDIISFCIDSNTKFFQHGQWVIVFTSADDADEKLGPSIEVMFVSTKSVSYKCEDIHIEDELDVDAVEKDTMDRLLSKAIGEENYELAAIIHSRLKKINKKLKLK